MNKVKLALVLLGGVALSGCQGLDRLLGNTNPADIPNINQPARIVTNGLPPNFDTTGTPLIFTGALKETGQVKISYEPSASVRVFVQDKFNLIWYEIKSGYDGSWAWFEVRLTTLHSEPIEYIQFHGFSNYDNYCIHQEVN